MGGDFRNLRARVSLILNCQQNQKDPAVNHRNRAKPTIFHRLPPQRWNQLVVEQREDSTVNTPTSSTGFQPNRLHTYQTASTAASEGRRCYNSDAGIEASSPLSPLYSHDLKLSANPAKLAQRNQHLPTGEATHPLKEEKDADPTKDTRSRSQKPNRRGAKASKLTKANNHRREPTHEKKPAPIHRKPPEKAAPSLSNHRPSDSNSHHDFFSHHAPPLAPDPPP
ncbi:hypothetical protein ISN45_Aa01g018690 [Arabidopsis thaliana x Arabidopsis arenosa]|uniref:Uncharacterized protein n=1 Tax=Arabidopsis thaliana x Arabidopsis arenosa TaxID=1240361 RepID=A0A8T2C1D5_9BRAS|nr:hypothetical protein ISN45_Aa01g018690 [Arabidopsis thaliana x Arabidopsis arenosa]